MNYWNPVDDYNPNVDPWHDLHRHNMEEEEEFDEFFEVEPTVLDEIVRECDVEEIYESILGRPSQRMGVDADPDPF